MQNTVWQNLCVDGTHTVNSVAYDS